jgi:hypothetical protein
VNRRHNVETWGQVEAGLSFNHFACEYRRESCGSIVRVMRFAAARASV